MKNVLFVFLGVILQVALAGQKISFEQMTPSPVLADFEAVYHASVAFSDVDNDGDADALVTGHTGVAETAALYINSGSGSFTRMPETPFTPVSGSAVAFSDVDGDGDPDLLITGSNGSNYSARLFLNDGGGVFSVSQSAVFDGVGNSALEFADVDGDSDQDVLITGYNGLSVSAKLYLNNGSGGFSAQSASPFTGVQSGDVAFADVDGDQDPDLAILGSGTCKLYRNDGTGTFTEVAGTAFGDLTAGSLAFADVDGDSDMDLFVNGKTGSGELVARLFRNNGSGSFSLVAGTPFIGVFYSDCCFTDIDSDGDQDLLVSGFSLSLNGDITRLYLNNGSGSFSIDSDCPVKGLSYSSVACADIDQDGDTDLLLAGRSDLLLWTGLYLNTSEGDLTEVVQCSLEDVFASSVSLVDVDGDNDRDVFCAGSTVSGSVSKIYRNSGNGGFSEIEGLTLSALINPAADFADIDGDLDQDLVITGTSGFSGATKLYKNLSTGIYTENNMFTFRKFTMAACDFADVDGDNDMDLIIAGRDQSGEPVCILHINDGYGSYSESAGNSFSGIRNGTVDFFDADLDGDPDLMLTGKTGSGNFSGLFLNDGTGLFEEAANNPFTAVSYSSVAVGDIDGDLDPDLILTGLGESDPVAEVFLNNGSAGFSVASSSIEPVSYSSIALADLDLDGDLDLLLTGKKVSEAVTKIYANNGQGVFTEVPGLEMRNVMEGSVAVADLNGDFYPEIVLTGRTDAQHPVSRIYRNLSDSGVGIPSREYSGKETGIRIFPNPSNGTFSLDLGRSDISGAGIFDIGGRLLVQLSDVQTQSLDLALSPGLYIVIVRYGNNEKSSSRLIILRD